MSSRSAATARYRVVLADVVPRDGRQDAAQVAEEELQVRDRRLLLPALGAPHLAHGVAAYRAEHRAVPLGVAPPQVGVQQVADDVVGGHAVAAERHHRQVRQPPEELVGVLLLAQHVAQQALRGRPRHGRHLERAAVGRGGHPGHEPAEQPRPQVGRQPREVDVGVAEQDVGRQREGQRVSVRDGQRRRAAGLGDAPSCEVALRVVRGQVAQRDDPQQARPAGIRAPARAWRVPARDHGEGRGREAGQEPVTHPAVDGGEALVAVDEKHQPLPGGQGDRAVAGGHVEHPPDGLEHALRGTRHVVAVEAHDARPGVAGPGGELVEEAALAHAPRAVHEQDPDVGVVGVEGVHEEVELSGSPHEVAVSQSLQFLTEGLRRGVDPPGHAPIVAPARPARRSHDRGHRVDRGQPPGQASTRRSRVTSARVRQPVRAIVRSSSATMLRSTSDTPSAPARARP